VRGHRLDIPTQAQARRRELCIVEVVDQTRELTSLVCDRGENELIIGIDHSYSPLAGVQMWVESDRPRSTVSLSDTHCARSAASARSIAAAEPTIR
jgi:hypothetical protein